MTDDERREFNELKARVRSLESGRIPSNEIVAGLGDGKPVWFGCLIGVREGSGVADAQTAMLPSFGYDPALGPDVRIIGMGGSRFTSRSPFDYARLVATEVANDLAATVAATTIAWGETLSGDANSINRIFYSDYIATDVGIMFSDTAFQRPARYTRTGRRIVFDFAPAKHVVWTYPYDANADVVTYSPATMASVMTPRRRVQRKVTAIKKAMRARGAMPWLGMRGR